MVMVGMRHGERPVKSACERGRFVNEELLAASPKNTLDRVIKEYDFAGNRIEVEVRQGVHIR